jgi:hypothetical protein
LTQLIRIREANRIAAAEVAISRDDLKNCKAQADLLQAKLGYLLAWVELERAAGQTPGF